MRGGAAAVGVDGGGNSPVGPCRAIGAPEPAPAWAISSGSSISGAGGRPSGRAGAGVRFGLGVRLAIAAGPVVGRAMHRQVEMEMIVMKHIGARPQHGGEMLAGAGMDFMQEGGFLLSVFFQSWTMRCSARPPA